MRTFGRSQKDKKVTDSQNSMAKRYQEIQSHVQSHKATLIAVSKKQPLQRLEELYHLGHRDFGENYVQDLCQRAEELKAKGCNDIRWHFIGHLQSNKVKKLLPHLYCLHTLASASVLSEIEKHWQGSDPLQVFVQVNIDGEDSKSGLSEEDLDSFLERASACPKISVQGLMAIPKPESGAEAFRQLAQVAENSTFLPKKQLSMGMSQDYQAALQAGATHVRVGSLLFGPRAT